MGDDVLGVPKAWQIKDFPEGLRNRIIAAARDSNQSVAEYVTGAMLRHLESTATGLDTWANGFANRVNHPGLNPSKLAGLMHGMSRTPCTTHATLRSRRISRASVTTRAFLPGCAALVTISYLAIRPPRSLRADMLRHWPDLMPSLSGASVKSVEQPCCWRVARWKARPVVE